MVAFCAALGYVSAHFLTGNMLEAEWQATAELVRYQVRAHGLERLFTDPALRADRDRYRLSLGGLLALPEVVRVKVWDRQGGVIWATDPRLVGQRFPGNRDLETALGGRVSVQLKPLTKAEHVYEREEYARLAEVYVPIRADGRGGAVIGVLEVYKVPARLFATIRRVTAAVWGAVGLGGGLLYLALFGIARMASHSQRRLERRLEERSRQLADRNTTLEFFLQSASHDLKASAVAIHGLASRLLEDHGGPLDGDARRLVHRLQLNAEHQERVLADLLTLSRIGTTGRAVCDVDTTVLVREVVDECRADVAAESVGAEAPAAGRAAVAGGAPVKVTVADSLPVIHGQPEELRAVFRHLVANALRYMGDQPTPEIEVRGEEAGAWAEFAVTDNGMGIDPAYHEKIFKLFERLTVEEDGGTGVGLTIVKRIVESVGGRVWVKSTPGAGATFGFRVPRVWPAWSRG